jgi:Cu/Ag efflux protein CusF
MESMILKCPVTVKAKVTEQLKAQMAAEIQDAVRKTDMELQQIDFHAKRVLAEQARVDAQGLTALRQQIEAEKAKRVEFKTQMTERLKETAALEIGAEIVQGNMDRTVTVSVGDNLHEIMSAEILLEDGKIIAFRS